MRRSGELLRLASMNCMCDLISENNIITKHLFLLSYDKWSSSDRQYFFVWCKITSRESREDWKFFLLLFGSFSSTKKCWAHRHINLACQSYFIKKKRQPMWILENNRGEKKIGWVVAERVRVSKSSIKERNEGGKKMCQRKTFFSIISFYSVLEKLLSDIE